ncbi:DNA polymerase III subunit delta' [Clostridium taeniosporum]|uniref:DNA polymerase III subunit delta' n=1 Tax=Clostridium taeniosporum TaxID=394958 RepID=A0A1D7XG88_9CLOT|nr:DNA polymerase III subunit delta' [Clostridium taeniosporum]AOR22365.1 DNA polymerase III subunit delta' [Clostridium taeniosporum]
MREIIGHERIINGFNLRKKNNAFSHANLIIGDDGIGKSLIATYLANSMLGLEGNKEFVDIINYSPLSSSFGVDDIRNIIEEVAKKPFQGDKKVLILHKCEKMTIQAQNALLKTIEEPPKGVYLILLSESLELILDTIKSRCQTYKLTPLSKDEIDKYISYKYCDIDLENRKAALAYSQGIPGKVEKFIEDHKLNKLRNILLELLYDLENKKEDFVLKYKEILGGYKDKQDEVLNILISYIRDIMFLKELDSNGLIVNFDKLKEIEDISIRMSYKKLNSMLEYIKEARISLNNNNNYSMTITVLLMGFVEV